MSLPDSAPTVTKERNGWHVSHVCNGRLQTYVCETERQARRFAELLSTPLVLPALERKRGQSTKG